MKMCCRQIVLTTRYCRRTDMRVKTMIMALAMTLTSVASFAQNAKSVNLTFGVMYPQTVDATLSYEVGTAHHNAWEFFANAASKWKDCASCGHVCPESFWKDNRTWRLVIILILKLIILIKILTYLTNNGIITLKYSIKGVGICGLENLLKIMQRNF